MTRVVKTRTVIVNRRRFICFIILTMLLAHLLISGFVSPNVTKADEEIEPALYVVTYGDTLWSIAEDAYGEDVDIRKAVYSIKKYNSLKSNNLISGQELLIPAEI